MNRLTPYRSQLRTSLILLLAFYSIILVFSAFIYLSATDYAHDDFYHLLEIRARAEISRHQAPGIDAEAAQQGVEAFGLLPKQHEIKLPIEALTTFDALADSLVLPVYFFHLANETGSAEYEHDNIYYKAIRYEINGTDWLIIASAENYYVAHHHAYLRKIMLTAAVVALFLSVIIAFYFSKYLFGPLRSITNQVKEISSENLHLRLDTAYKNDELNDLAKTFNDMLDRIETSFETQNNFISNASHELRTPLTAIIGEADVSLSKLRKPDAYIESIKIILDEAEKLDQKTKALLFLAQTGFKGKVMRFERLRADQLLWDVKETLERLDPNNKVLLDMSLLPENPNKLKIKGNEQLLHLAFTNIISNGCKYSNHQPVTVSLGATDSEVKIIVIDQGIGIPAHELKYIYDPFFRASNTKSYEGYGIGLPLTRNIIRMHQGRLLVSSEENKGTTVEISLPITNMPA